MTASPSTTGTKMALARSASRSIGARDDCACSTMRVICASTVSSPSESRLADDGAVVVERAGQHAVSRFAGQRSRFAGQHRFIHGGAAFQRSSRRPESVRRAEPARWSPSESLRAGRRLRLRPRCGARWRGAGGSERRAQPERGVWPGPQALCPEAESQGSAGPRRSRPGDPDAGQIVA